MPLPFPDQTVLLAHTHHGAGTAVEVVVYGATPRVRGYVLEEDGPERVWMFDVSPSLVRQVQGLVAGALAGEAGSVTPTGWQISLTAAAESSPSGRELQVSFQDGETTMVWPLADHSTQTELTDFQRLLNSGPL